MSYHPRNKQNSLNFFSRKLSRFVYDIVQKDNQYKVLVFGNKDGTRGAYFSERGWENVHELDNERFQSVLMLKVLFLFIQVRYFGKGES